MFYQSRVSINPLSILFDLIDLKWNTIPGTNFMEYKKFANHNQLIFTKHIKENTQVQPVATTFYFENQSIILF